MTGTEITNYDDVWAKRAAEAAANEPLASATSLTTRGGILRYGEEEMPGNQAAVIVLDSIYENTYYADKFDPDALTAPICYAFARGSEDAEEMSPHESMQADLNYFQPQADTCRTCPHNEWGSADKGRGKACQNRRRLLLIPAGFYTPKRGSRDFDLELFNDVKDFSQADIASIKLPVMSVKNWSKYVSDISASLHRPPEAVITRLFIEQDAKSQYRVEFEVIEPLPNDFAAAIMAKQDQALAQPFRGYMPPEEKEQRPAGRGGLRGLRR